MEYHEYEALIGQAAQLNNTGAAAQASAIFLQLADDPERSDMDRALMYHNAAQCLSTVGSPEEVERLYDEAIEREKRWYRSTTRDAKAAWLARVGRSDEAIEIYRSLMQEPWLTEGQRRTYEEQIFRLRT